MHRIEILEYREKKKTHLVMHSVWKGKMLTFYLWMKYGMVTSVYNRRTLEMLSTLRHPKVRSVSGAILAHFLFSSYPSSTDFHNTWVTGSGHLHFGSIQRRLNTFLPSLCWIGMNHNHFFLSTMTDVIAITWGEVRTPFSTRFHKSEFKRLHYSSWKQMVRIPV